MQHELFATPAPGPSLFFALLPAASDRLALDAALAELRASAPKLQPMAAGKRHVTLLYLGQPADVLLAPQVEAARRAAAGVSAGSFVLNLQEVAVFGRNALVLLAPQVPPALAALEERLRRAVLGAGLAPPRGRFQPHLTLAHVDAAVRAKARSCAPLRLAFDAFVLLRGGRRDAYEELGRWPLEAG
ncbi:MAG: 2'-5' RNA ligase family protein [Pseudoxanthomonas sp.]